MAYETIVVGTDGSVTANYARDAAARLALAGGAGLVVVSAFDGPAARAGAESAAAVAVREVAREGVRASAQVIQGEPAEAIIGAAEASRAGLIVVGNKGMGHPSRFRLGSVPDRVAHFAPCDLLIVDTSRFAEEGRRPADYRLILAATDGSPTAAEAARKAFDLAEQVDASVLLLYVGDPVLGAIKLEEAARGAPRSVRLETRVMQGDPADQICAVAADAGADLIVTGNRGLSGARRFLLGSVPNTVAHYAPGDVLIAKTVDRTLEDIAAGHGAVIEVEGKATAVYRDEGGRILRLSARCTHMGCTVGWNDADRTWDCPCHGSRYAFDGKVIRGPAMRGLDGSEATPRRQAAAPAASRRDERYVIVGASLAGGTAAATLRDEGFDGRIVLIGAEAHYPYERPPLSKAFLRGETAFEEAMVRPVDFFRQTDVETRFATVAVRVDPLERRVEVADGDPVPFDRLLVATGARNRTFPIRGFDLPGVYGLRTVGDAERIRAEISPGRRVVIAGMGFIGSEVAASLRQRGLEVVTVDGGQVPLQRVLGTDVGRVMEGIHRDHGVQMFFQDRVAAFEGMARVERVLTAAGRALECDFAVVGLGVEPVTEFLAGSGVQIENGVLVDEFCRTNVGGIYAAGDVANHHHPVFGRRIRIEHWQNAIRQGRAAALNMLDRDEPYAEIHWFWSDQYEHNLQYAGYHTDWDELAVRGSLDQRSFVAFYLKEGTLQSVVAMDRGAELGRAMRLVGKPAAASPEVLADDQVDLATLS